MNAIAIATLVAYFVIGGLAYSYGSLRSHLPVKQQAKQEQQQSKLLTQQKEQRAAQVPPDEPIHIDLLYLGVDKSGNGASFNFKTCWGNPASPWRVGEKPLSAQRKAGASAKLDLDWCKAEIKPLFGEGRRGQYSVRLTDKGGALMASFRLEDAGKQVKLASSATPGYDHRLVFYEPERRVTTYRIMRSGSKKQDVCGVVFLGKGWSAVEETKKADDTAVHIFPQINIMILPKAWMEGNDIGTVMTTLKRGSGNALVPSGSY